MLSAKGRCLEAFGGFFQEASPAVRNVEFQGVRDFSNSRVSAMLRIRLTPRRATETTRGTSAMVHGRRPRYLPERYVRQPARVACLLCKEVKIQGGCRFDDGEYSVLFGQFAFVYGFDVAAARIARRHRVRAVIVK